MHGCGFYSVGCFLVGRVTAFTGRRRQRGLLLFFSCLETTIFFACTAVIYSVRMDLDDDTDPATIAVVCLLSFAMGSQQIWGRDLGIPEVTITVLTNVCAFGMLKFASWLTLSFLFMKASASILADPKLFAPITANRSRNVRLVFVTVFFVGCIIGGVMLNFVNLATALLLNAILKLAGPITFLITRNKVITGSDISKSEELTIDQIQHGNP